MARRGSPRRVCIDVMNGLYGTGSGVPSDCRVELVLVERADEDAALDVLSAIIAISFDGQAKETEGLAARTSGTSRSPAFSAASAQRWTPS